MCDLVEGNGLEEHVHVHVVGIIIYLNMDPLYKINTIRTLLILFGLLL